MQKFEFNLKHFQNIKNLKLLPLNDFSVINISEIYLVLDDNSLYDLKENIQANVCSHHSTNYFFESKDSHIYFDNINFEILSIKKIVIELIYSHIAKDALQSCVYQVINDKNYIIENLENERNSLENERNSLENERNSLENERNKIYNSFYWKILNLFNKRFK